MIAAVLVAALVGSSAVAAAAASCSAKSLSVSYPAPVAADGWSYRVVANGFTKPRGILLDSAGALIVVDSGVGLLHLALKDEGGSCVSVAKQTTLVKSPDLNHGLALSEDGKTLYASSYDKVYAWSYDSSRVAVGDTNRTLVANMSNSDHTTRTLLLSRKQPGTLLVSRGSNSNQDDSSKDLDSGHAQIRSFDIGRLTADDGPYDFLDGRVLGWGLRNSVGVVEEPHTGGIWAVENSVDELSRDGHDIHQNNPGEELNFLGFLNGSSKDQGGNYGYPQCFALWSKKDFPDLGHLIVGDQFPSTQTKSLTDETCNKDFIAPRLTFQAHAAPLDIKFTDEADEAFISFHGSWNRDDPIGYRVASVAFSGGNPTAANDSTDAAADVLTNKDVSQCPDKCFRPVGLALDGGRLWFSSDATGEIFLLYRNATASGHDSGDDGEGEGVAAQLVPGRSATWAVAFAAVVLGVFLA